ncbi:putative DNA-binding domain-containing protein [Usitatibacter palustris]|uniref:Putative DNA-binding domain-containing protein n=1 Tax=Usitatibacter palustris TaxID=2732487 RepID=A0A6M4H9N3_9PROT|nr:putative DNA-binding domain-containing protein [Usitatibacter palustris]QJR16300.1 hypothetical protein DSM104440_03129 [Usitatibacter palustris]
MRLPVTLAEQQREFLAAVSAAEPRALPGIRAGRATPSDRLEAYRRNVAANWRGALADTYPVVARLVGPAFFSEAAARYTEVHPSTSGDLHRFGAQFATFLAGYPHAGSVEYLADVARVEWAVHRAQFAANAAPFDLASLARVPADEHERLRFRLHPAVGLIASPHPVLAIWEANQPDRDGTPDPEEGPDFLIVTRDGIEREDEPAWRFLDALANGETLGEAAECFEANPTRLAPALREFVADGVITGFTR